MYYDINYNVNSALSQIKLSIWRSETADEKKEVRRSLEEE